MNEATCGNNILSSLHNTLEIALKYGEPGKFIYLYEHKTLLFFKLNRI